MTQQFDADVVVIGSGALGANAAYELAKAGKSVIILEAGDRVPRWKIVQNFRNSSDQGNNNAPYPNEPWAHTSYEKDYIDNVGSFSFRPGMLKLAGGTTHHWAAATWRYIPNDMKLKSVYGVGRDWPIEYAELEPYYCRAEAAVGSAGCDEEDQSGQGGKKFPPRSKPYPLQAEAKTYAIQRLQARLAPMGYNFIHEPVAKATKPYDGRPVCAGNNSCMPVCPIGAMYSGDIHVAHAEKAGAKLITRATVYKLEKGKSNKITAVHYKTPEGDDKKISARYFIVAAHGLETPKLLLMSEIANSSDMVGRNLMDHTGAGYLALVDEPLWTGRGQAQQGGIFNWRDGHFRSEHSCFKHSLNNTVPNAFITSRLLQQGVLGSELDRQLKDQASRYISFSTFFEQLPFPENRVTPNPDKKDALGIPMLRVHYDVSDYIKNALPLAMNDYQNFTEGMNAEVINMNTGWQNRDHIMGTVIMGDDPKNSVVDGNCRTYDHDNLFLTTTGVIPAAGVINPTLTGIALALKAADTILREV
ncbi:GMC family oxidoreductase [Bartonella tamiae]|nr:GMC family oxidoreductase [Bartonella tamiae]